jgi:hypothetical protein
MGKTIGDINTEKGGGGPPLLKGSDVPKTVTTFKVKCRELRIAPDNFGSRAILDLDKPVYGKEAWAVNITSLRAIAIQLGFDDPNEADFDVVAKKAQGKIFTLSICTVNNPKENRMVRSLTIMA